MKNRLKCIFLLTLTCSQWVFASFTGSNVEIQVFYPDIQTPISTPFQTIVSSQVEFTELDTGALPGRVVADAHVDLSVESITWTFVDTGGFSTLPAGNFNGHVITDVDDSIPAITNVLVASDETTLSLPQNHLAFNENQIFLNLEGLSITPNDVIKVTVLFADNEEDIPMLGNFLYLLVIAFVVLYARRNAVKNT